MRIPKSVKIGAHEFTIRRLPPRLEKSKHGDCSYADLDIRIGRHRKRSKRQETTIHEILHTFFDATPLKWGELKEEDIVEFLAPKLLQLLRDNPKLVEYLTT